MKHTITANGIRQGHSGGLLLSQLHIGLAVGFTVIACLTAFGGGVIVGMWYKANEQIAPLAATASAPEKSAQGQDAGRPQVPPTPVTFYNTLTDSNVAYAPLTPPPTPASAVVQGQGNAVPLVAGPPSSPRALSVGATREPTGGAAESAKAAVAAPPSKTTSAGDTPDKARTVAPPPAAPAVATRPAERPKPAAPASRTAAAERQPERDARAARPASAAAVSPARAPSTDDFSVQVGSFGSAEQAERLRTNLAQKGYPVRVQPAAVPGQGLRYRVRVGSYAERSAADQTAHHLTAQEQVPAIVAGKD